MCYVNNNATALCGNISHFGPQLDCQLAAFIANTPASLLLGRLAVAHFRNAHWLRCPVKSPGHLKPHSLVTKNFLSKLHERGNENIYLSQ